MRYATRITIGIVSGVLVVGCRTATRVTEVPRVDLSLEGGNRGYLIGKPSGAAPLKTTRQMVQTDIELPTFYKPIPSRGAPVTVEGIAPPEMDMSESVPPAPSDLEPLSGSYDPYVVQRGDSLWSIAARPEVYGKATGWRRLFDANRDLLTSPDQLRPGMTLKIPRGGSAPAANEGTALKK